MVISVYFHCKTSAGLGLLDDKSMGPDEMMLPCHSPSYLKSHGCQMKTLLSGETETSILFLKRKGERKIWDPQNTEPHLCVWEDHGSNFEVHTAQGGDQRLPAQLY